MLDDLRGTEEPYPNTPDGRYFVVRGRLWRRSNPELSAEIRASLVRDLMVAHPSMLWAALLHDKVPFDESRRTEGTSGLATWCLQFTPRVAVIKPLSEPPPS